MTQQKETLIEFMNRRMAELGLGYKDISNSGIGAQTHVNIRNGKVTGLQEVTKQKLALLLQCSQGEINAAIANTVQMTKTGEAVIRKNPEPSVMETVAKLEQMVEKEYPELGSSADYGTNPQKPGTVSEKSAEKSFENETISDDTANDSSEPVTEKATGTWDFNCIENAKSKPKTKKINRTNIVAPKVQVIKSVADDVKAITVQEYRQQLKDMCLHEVLAAGSDVRIETAYINIGEKLVKELLGV